MAIAFDAQSSGFTTATATHTKAHTITGSDRLLLVNTLSTVNVVTGVTYNGTSMTQLGSTFTFSNGYEHQAWYLINPDTGTNNIVVTSTGSQNLFATAASYTGVKQTGFPDNNNHNNTTGVDEYNTSLTPVADGCWVALFGAGTSGVSTFDDGTERSNDGIVSMMSDNAAAVTPAASTQLDTEKTTAGTTDRSHFMVSFEAAGAGGGATPFSQAVVIM